MAMIAKRYVQALFDSSKDKAQSELYEKALKNLSVNFSNNQEFRNTLLNPCISNKEKLDLIKEAFKEYCEDETFVNFINELLEKNRINLIENISDEYTKMIDSERKEVTIKIVTAVELDNEQVQDIVSKYKKLYNANTINYEIELDKSTIGGVKVIVGNKIYDSTLKTRLSQIF